MSDPHLLALLRAIRLRQSAPDAAAAGEADTAAALSEIARNQTARKKKEAQVAEQADAGTPPYFSKHRAAEEDTPRGGSAGLLWRGDPSAVMGRANLRNARSAIPPIGGITPSGPTTPVPPIPALEGVRPPEPPGTDFPPQLPPRSFPSRRPRTSGPVRRAAGRDGMDPADDAALRDIQRNLSTSITFAGGVEDVAERLWNALHQAQPALLSSLPGTAPTQRADLARALTWLVHHLADPPAVVSGCARLGAVLAECGLQWNRLQLVGAALAEATRAGMPPGSWRQDFDQAWRWAWQHTYEWIVHGGTLVAYQPTIWDVEVVSHEQRREDLAVIGLRSLLPMPFRPGQFARFEVPEIPGVWRPYSLAGAPHRDEYIELHVRAKSETGVSGTLVHHTRRGARLRMTRAEGDMGLPDSRGILMIAGDTGVAPMKAMLAELAARGDTRQTVLLWSVRDQTELYDIDALTELAARVPGATVIPVVAEEPSGPYMSGPITDAVTTYGDWSRYEIYLAGPPQMLAKTTAALLRLGVKPDQMHYDPPE
ncbi:flavohemoprotein [Actinoplanes derwentensis]|uniref:flavohemoprotein n=1 Tax=Actinoplanes derwentensis TaxID=113562 RepID=UPI001E2D1A25|nr:flavohemoprotein [Actinoplanes derwentensis]